MKKTILIAAIIAGTTLASYAGAIVVLPGSTLLASWSFDAVTTTNTGQIPNFTAGSPVADAGTLTAGSAATAFHASAAAVYSNPAGNGSPKSLSSNGWAIGDYYQFTLATTGADNLFVSFSQVGSGTGPKDFKLSYSSDGGATFIDFITYSAVLNDWTSATVKATGTQSFDLSAITVLNNQPSVIFRLVDTSATSINNTTVAPGGTGRVDDFTVTDGPVEIVPEPTTFLTLVSGLGVLGLLRRRNVRA